MKRCVYLGVTAVLMSALAAHANYPVYVVKDENGVENKFMQFEPESGDYELRYFRNDGRVSVPSAPSELRANGNSGNAEQSRVSELESQLKEMEDRENAQRCSTLRNNLTNLNMGTRVYETDASGARTFLTDQQIVERRERIQQSISQFCQ